MSSDLGQQLAVAVKSGDELRVVQLLSMGANPNADYEGLPIIFFAVGSRNLGIIRLLMSHGADTSVLDPVGLTPTDEAEMNDDVDVLSVLLDEKNHEQSKKLS